MNRSVADEPERRGARSRPPSWREEPPARRTSSCTWPAPPRFMGTGRARCRDSTAAGSERLHNPDAGLAEAHERHGRTGRLFRVHGGRPRQRAVHGVGARQGRQQRVLATTRSTSSSPMRGTRRDEADNERDIYEIGTAEGLAGQHRGLHRTAVCSGWGWQDGGYGKKDAGHRGCISPTASRRRSASSGGKTASRSIRSSSPRMSYGGPSRTSTRRLDIRRTTIRFCRRRIRLAEDPATPTSCSYPAVDGASSARLRGSAVADGCRCGRRAAPLGIPMRERRSSPRRWRRRCTTSM